MSLDIPVIMADKIFYNNGKRARNGERNWIRGGKKNNGGKRKWEKSENANERLQEREMETKW